MTHSPTLTRAWIMAATHFMRDSAPCPSAAAFMTGTPRQLDSRIMLTRTSAAVLSSPEARQGLAQPDLSPIPEPA